MDRSYNLTDQDMELIFAGIGKLPFEAVVMLWNKLQAQRRSHEHPGSNDAQNALNGDS